MVTSAADLNLLPSSSTPRSSMKSLPIKPIRALKNNVNILSSECRYSKDLKVFISIILFCPPEAHHWFTCQDIYTATQTATGETVIGFILNSTISSADSDTLMSKNDTTQTHTLAATVCTCMWLCVCAGGEVRRETKWGKSRQAVRSGSSYREDGRIALHANKLRVSRADGTPSHKVRSTSLVHVKLWGSAEQEDTQKQP